MKNIKEIYLGGGCFWGLEMYMKNVSGVIATEAGYANGNTESPAYEEVCAGSGHAEVCRVMFDTRVSGLRFILERYFDVIDPVSVNKQGGDIGVQYRTGIYYTDTDDIPLIKNCLDNLQSKHDKPLAIEFLPLKGYTAAEEYHQDYLNKNPGGYCHISPWEIREVKHYRDERIASTAYAASRQSSPRPSRRPRRVRPRERTHGCRSCNSRR